MPIIQDVIDNLQGCKFFSSMDCESAYHQVLLDPSDIQKTAFITKWGLFEFKVLVFGLCNAPAAFVAELTAIFKDILGVFVILYLDDILIFSKTAEEHVLHVAEVCRRLQLAEFYIKISNCAFMVHELKFLGHIVGKDGVKVDPEKVKAIKAWLSPTCPKEIKSFVGLANYFRRFVLGFSTLVAPLTNLTKADTPWGWTPECEISFQKLKDMLCTAPVLALPNPSLQHTVISDASLVGTRAVLVQNEQPIAYTSSKFIPAEIRYSTTEQEMLGVVRALFAWRCYLEGAAHPTVLVTDHKPLTYFKSQKELSRRQARRWNSRNDLIVFGNTFLAIQMLQTH